MKKTIKGQFEKLMAEVAAAIDVKFTDFARGMNDIMTKPDWSTIKPLPKKSFLKGMICLFIRHKWILGWWCRRCGKQRKIKLDIWPKAGVKIDEAAVKELFENQEKHAAFSERFEREFHNYPMPMHYDCRKKAKIMT